MELELLFEMQRAMDGDKVDECALVEETADWLTLLGSYICKSPLPQQAPARESLGNIGGHMLTNVPLGSDV